MSQVFGWILQASGVLVVVGLLAFVIATLQGAITNTTVETIYNNTLLMITNFTGQLATVGTLAGVFVIFALMGLVGLGGYIAYQKYGGRGGVM
jgi:hypothetical protein